MTDKTPEFVDVYETPAFPQVIYLIPDGDGNATWCDDPAPGMGMDECDAIKYVKAKDAIQLRADIFNYFAKEHRLTMTESDIENIVNLFKASRQIYPFIGCNY